MQKFNNKNIDKLLEAFESTIFRISNLLSIEGRLGLNQIEQLNDLYKQRDSAVSFLIDWSNSDEGKSWLINNKNNIKSRISNIMENDKKHIKNIENRLTDLKQNLRNLANSKSLLIYSKEQIL